MLRSLRASATWWKILCQNLTLDQVYTYVYIVVEEKILMRISKVFTSGNSQAIRLPKEYQVKDKELYIQKIGNTIILFPKKNPWQTFVNSLDEFTDDFMSEGRNQPPIQKREAL
jgi:antitoxin VapB